MNKNKKLKIAVAMSGGVDSSVAAKLLKNQGHEVIGIFLHFWHENRGLSIAENKCCSTEALLDARRVADKIGIRLYALNFAGEFKRQVVDNFLTEYSRGRTPNPCVRCNKLVKLGYLIKQAKKLGFDQVASGHYALIKKAKKQKSQNSIYKLYKANDKNKDQSYFLYTFKQNELKHLLFPLGNYTKPEVRAMAKKFKLLVAEKKESQEICFIAERDHNDFLKRHLKLKSGKIKTFVGKVLGNHGGLPLYTIGQRKGIEIGGTGPYYVAKMDYKKNILYVVDDNQDSRIFKSGLIAKNVNWIAVRPRLPLKCQAVIRYRHQPVKCIVKKSGVNYDVKFKDPQRAVTPGQSVVFYSGKQVLGGGIIS